MCRNHPFMHQSGVEVRKYNERRKLLLIQSAWRTGCCLNNLVTCRSFTGFLINYHFSVTSSRRLPVGSTFLSSFSLHFSTTQGEPGVILCLCLLSLSSPTSPLIIPFYTASADLFVVIKLCERHSCFRF